MGRNILPPILGADRRHWQDVRLRGDAKRLGFPVYPTVSSIPEKALNEISPYLGEGLTHRLPFSASTLFRP